MIGKYRKKPVIIEACQFTGDNGAELVKFCEGNLKYNGEKDEFTVVTIEGFKPVPIDYWIIKGIQGEFYPCKADIFSQTYEEVIAQ